MRARAIAMAVAALVPVLLSSQSTAHAVGSPVAERGLAAANSILLPAGAGSEQINAAIDAAVAAGRPLHAPAGTYTVDKPIFLRSGLTLTGDAGAVFRATTALGDRPVMINADFNGGDHHIALSGFTVDAKRAERGNAGPTAHGIWLHGSDEHPMHDVTIRDVTVRNAPMLGVPLQNVQDATIERLTSHGHGRDGLTLYFDSQRIQILHPTIYDVGDDMIGLNAEDGTSTGHRLEDILIQSPRLTAGHDQGSGIAIHGARRVTVNDAQVSGSFHAALSIGNWNSTPAREITVNGLQALDPGISNRGGAGHGIEIYAGAANRSHNGTAGVDGVVLTGIDIQRPRAQGIALFGGPGAEISNVRIQGQVTGPTLYEHSYGLLSTTGHVSGLDISEFHSDLGVKLEGVGPAPAPDTPDEPTARPAAAAAKRTTRLRVPRRQGRRRITVQVRCNVACDEALHGRIVVGRRTIRVAGVAHAAAGRWTRVTLRPGHRGATALRRALRHGHVQAQLTVRLGDGVSARRAVRLR